MTQQRYSDMQFEDGHLMDTDGPFIVIGANGFLGSEVCTQLRRRNRWSKIVAVVRSTEPSEMNPRLTDLKVDLMECPSVVTEDFLEQCLDRACEQLASSEERYAGIFHVAGITMFSHRPEDLQRMYASNVELTEAIFAFASKRKLRTVYASCSGVVGCQFMEHCDRVSHDDSIPCDLSIEDFPFLVQKRAVELKWHNRALLGLAPIIFLRPSTLLGPGDERIRSTYCLYEILQGLGTMPVRYGGGISFCDVRDVATAFIEAMIGPVRGGTAMNLTAANLPYEEFVALVESTLRISGSRLVPLAWIPRLPAWCLRSTASLKTWASQVCGLAYDERSSPEYVAWRTRYFNVTCQRAKLLLRWDPRDLEDTIQDTARYLVNVLGGQESHRLVKRGPARRVGVAGLQKNKDVASLSWKHPLSSTTKDNINHNGKVTTAGMRWSVVLRAALIALCIVIALVMTFW